MAKKDAELDRCLDQLFSECERDGFCLAAPAERRLHQALRRRAEYGEIVRPHRGMYARSAWWNAQPRSVRALCVLRSLQAKHPDWVFCHESAALAYGLPVSYGDMETVHVATSRRNRNRTSGSTRWHVIEVESPVRREGIWVTPLERTLFDCMRTEPFGRALAVVDQALRNWPRLSRSALMPAFLGMAGGCAGVSQAVRALYHADARSESPGESMARARMIDLGFALPRLQVSLPRPMEPNRQYRVDFLWTRFDGSGVIGEFDGMQKYEDPTILGGRSPLRALAEEQHREAQLSLYGMPIVRIAYKDLVDESRFVRLLSLYDIPRDEGTPALERRLIASHCAVAIRFMVLAPAGAKAHGMATRRIA